MYDCSVTILKNPQNIAVNHPKELSSNEMIEQRLYYTHYNPVESGFVGTPEDYPYSSARDYAEEQGLLKVILIRYID